LFWLTDAIRYIDFTKDIFIRESVVMMYYTKGGLDIQTIFDLPFNEYEVYLDEAIKIQKQLNAPPKQSGTGDSDG